MMDGTPEPSRRRPDDLLDLVDRSTADLERMAARCFRSPGDINLLCMGTREHAKRFISSAEKNEDLPHPDQFGEWLFSIMHGIAMRGMNKRRLSSDDGVKPGAAT